AGAAKPAVIIQRDEYAKVERYRELAYTLHNLLFQVMYFTSGSVLVWYLWLVRPFIKHINSRTFASSFRRTTKKHLSYSLGPAFLRHLLTAFARRNGGGKGQGLHVLSPDEVLNFVNQADADSREMQAGHTAATAKAVYALQSQLVFQSRFTMPKAHLKTSVIKADDAATQEETRLSYVNLRQILKVNLSLHLRFCGLQQAVVQDIVNIEPIVAYIAGTGSRKSLAFLLPACCPGFGQQVVVTPLVALRIDITNRCAGLSITHSQFGQDDFDETCTILLASPEDLSKPDFMKLIRRRWDAGQLERIVLDEFHYVLLPDHKYQPSLLKMRDVAQYRIPITLLSTTVPANEDQQEAYRRLRLHGQYEVKELSAPFSIPLLTSYVRREEGKELSTSLGCSCYHRGLPEAERTVIQTSFSTAKRAVLVATVAFVAGVDIPDISCILWFRAPNHPITFAQGIGRGGRNGQTCVARIVFRRGILSFLGKLEDRNAQWVMQQILNCNYCLRIPINLYLNRDSKRTAAYDGSYAASTPTPSKTGPPVDQACTASLRKRNRPLSLVSSSPLARRDEVSRAAAKAARTNNCIKCFVDGQAYDHLKGSCNCSIGPIVRYYKDNRIGRKLGTSMCYSCAMLQDLPKAKDIWLQQIREESNGTLDGAKEADFVSYFRQVLRFTHQYPVCQIAFDVNWFTHEYFITADKSKALLGSLL
ncbi:P-loop containing nucleoside triphosphate hydrolase protein, partial [Pleomassaria siparia CBS 279.74]